MKRLSLTQGLHVPGKNVLTILLFFLFATSMFAQSRTVSGKLIDENTGEPLIGASVLVKGTTVGTITDIDGGYAIEAAPGDVLVISYVGYGDREITVGDSAMLDINLSQGVLVNEVVVTGYQSQRKRDITGAVSVISSDDLNTTPAASMSQKLAGRAPGLVTTTSGNPGDGTQILIRGVNSFEFNDPLIVIDGVPTRDTYLNSINPNDIESIQVLKDAASSTIYGARASNGVIIITTKRGKTGEAKVKYDVYTGTQTPVNRFELANAQEYFDYVKKAAPVIESGVYMGESYPDYYHGDPSAPYDFIGRDANGDPINQLMKVNKEGTDWWDAAIGPAPINEHNLNVSGGSENANYSFSGNYFNQQGTIIHSFFERYSARANSSFKAGRFTFGENISISRINQVGQAGGNQDEQNVITNIIRIQPFVPVYDEGGVNFAGPKGNLAGLGNNPVKRMWDDKDDIQNYTRLFGNFFGEVEIIEGLSARTSLGVDQSTGFQPNATFPNFEAREINQRIFSYSENWNSGFSWTWTNTLNFNRNIGEKHNINAVVGTEAFRERNRDIGGSYADYFVFGLDSRYLNAAIGNNDSRSVGSGGSIKAFASTFAKVDYVYDDFLILSGTVRRDGSSTFAPEFRYATFPAFSVGLRLNKFINMEQLDDLKLRFSYGLSGNDAVRADNAFALFGGGTGNSFYDINGTGNSIVTGFALQARANADGKWEELRQWNVGVDAAFMNGKFGLVFDVYSKNTIDLLFRASLPGTAGSATPAFVNIANMSNNGFDAALTFRDRLSADLGINASLTIGRYVNEITGISDSQDQFTGNNGSRIGAVSINRLGEPVGSYYGYETDGLFQSQGEVDSHAEQVGAYVGGLRFKDQNNDGSINDDDRVILGNYHPDFTAGLNLGATYKGFDLTAFFFGSFGAEIYNFNKLFHDFSQFEANVLAEVANNHWSPTNTGSDIPFPSFDGRVNNTQSSDYYVEDGTYVRLQNLQLGYRLPSSTPVLGGSRIYVQGSNLLTFTGYSGLDPAMSNFGRSVTEAGIDFGNYPSNKTLMVGLNIEF